MNLVGKLRRLKWAFSGRLKIKKLIRKNSSSGSLKIILGAGSTAYDGWISTDIPHLNIVTEKDWEFFFRSHLIDSLLAEHVLEHLTKEEVESVLSLSYRYLKPAGTFRIAVPDGYHHDPDYIKYISPPSQGHQSFWNVDSLQEALRDAGFKTEPLEFYTREGIYQSKDFDYNNGIISRSKTKGYNNIGHPGYSSLIIDAYKPAGK